jgi:hypothetical protein
VNEEGLMALITYLKSLTRDGGPAPPVSATGLAPQSGTTTPEDRTR